MGARGVRGARHHRLCAAEEQGGDSDHDGDGDLNLRLADHAGSSVVAAQTKTPPLHKSAECFRKGVGYEG